MAAGRVASLFVDIAANVVGIKQDFDQIQRHINQFSRQVTSTLKMFGIAAGSGLSMAGVVAQVHSWISAAGEAETASAKLAGALRAHGVTSKDTVTAYKNLASSIQMVSQYSDEAVMDVMRLLTALGVGPAKIEPATRAALKLSSVLGVDFDSAAKAVAAGMQGIYGPLNRITRQFDGLAKGSLTADQVLKRIEQTVGDGATDIDTYDKKLAHFKNTWGELAENMGNLFLPVAKDVLDVLSQIAHESLRLQQVSVVGWWEKELQSLDKQIEETKKNVGSFYFTAEAAFGGIQGPEASPATELIELFKRREMILKKIQELNEKTAAAMTKGEGQFKKVVTETAEHTKKQVDEIDKEFQRTVKGWEHLAQAWKGYLDPIEMQADLQYVYRAQKAMYVDNDKFIQKWEADIESARSKLKGLGDSGTSEFKRLEDAITMVGSKFSDTIADMVLGAKVSFTDMIDSMIHDLVRFQIQAQMTQFVPAITRGIGGIAGGWFGGGTTGVPAYSPERQPGALTMGAGAAASSAAGAAAAGGAAGMGNPIVTAALIAFAIAESQSGGKVSATAGNLMENKYLATIFPFFNPGQTYESWKELITNPKKFLGQGEDEASKVAFGFNLPASATSWERTGPLGTIGLTKEKGVSGSDLESALRSWVKFDEEVAKLLSEEQIAKIKTMAGWSTATYHDFEGKDFDDAMIDRFRRIGRELGEDFTGELMAAFKGGTEELAAYLDKMELIDKIRDWFAMTGMEDIFINWEDFTEEGLAALDKLIAEWTKRMESATASAAGSFQAGMQEGLQTGGGWESFEGAVRKHILDSVTSGLIAGFAQTAIVQRALAPFFATMDEAFTQAFAGGTFNREVWDALMGPAAAGLNASIYAMNPIFYALADLIAKLNESLAGVPSYQGGTDYVPRTGLYRLHQGEAVLSSESPRGGHLSIGSLITVHGSLVADRGEFDRFVLQIKQGLDRAIQYQRPGKLYAERRMIDAGARI